MLACVDVGYRASTATAACILFSTWEQPVPEVELVRQIKNVAPYQSGKFYKRELPCILTVLKMAPIPPDIIIIDGYVWLNPENRPGLGAYLYEARYKTAAVIGVAKNRFFQGPNAVSITRGASRRPLFVTSVGISLGDAIAGIARMHGGYRIPTLLTRADRISRVCYHSNSGGQTE